MNKVTKALLAAGVVICLLQVWWPAYYLTGDGPCHLYNAQVLHDLWRHKNISFYQPFFNIDYHPNPNWFATLLLALLLFVVKGVIAEKIFLTLYIFTYTSGFYLLLKKISGNNIGWLPVIFIFVFTQALAKGFYNFSFSIAFYFWVVWSFLRFLGQASLRNATMFFVFTLLLFFTHLMPFVFASFTCFTLIVSFAVSGATNNQKPSAFFLKYALLLTLFLTPFMILMGWFIGHEGGMQLNLAHHFYRLIELAQFKYIVNEVHYEDLFALVAGCSLLIMFLACFLSIKSRFKINKYDGFLITLLFVLFIYLFFPEGFMGRVLAVAVRVQLFVFILVACCVGYRLQFPKIIMAGSAVLFICFTGLSIVRISNQLTASQAVNDYLSAGPFIKPLSVVLPLNFSRSGMDGQGHVIADRNHLFSHISGYMGTEKPLIILDNYEANMGYFPLEWTRKTNPYNHLSKDEGIEGCPPYAVINDYKQTSGVNIDYILMWCFDSSYLQNEHFKSLYSEVNAGYHLMYTSATCHTKLYGKN